MPAKKKKNLLVDHPAWAERLSKEWDWEKNDKMGIKPDEITAGSHKKVAWRCEKGHEWEARIPDRVSKNLGCPYCSGRRVLAGFNDLASQRPELAREWHPTKNGSLTPQDISPGSNKGVYWLGDCGHTWKATPNDRSRRGRGCPYCSGNRVLVGFNDLATTNHELAREWHPTKNGSLTPQDVSLGSNKGVYWLGDCGHTWKATVNDRMRGHGCSVCAGKRVLAGHNDLASAFPQIASQWHPKKNGNVLPTDVTPKSSFRAIWICNRGHEWQARVADRTGGNGCPYCSGRFPVEGETDLATTHPDIAKDWHPALNGSLTPKDVSAGSDQRVYWLGRCGHEWAATVGSRTRGSGCPKCASSRGEKNAATWAVSQGLVVDEQWRDSDCRDQLPLPFDLMLYSVAGTALMETALVEYDGKQHSDENAYFNQKALLSGTGYDFDYVQRHDAIKTEFCKKTHRILIRVPYTVTGAEAIGEYISEKLRENGLGWAVGGCDPEVA